MLRAFLCLLAVTASALAQATSDTKLGLILDKGLTVPWQDGAIGHAELLAFREQLKNAARNHDAKAILQAADPAFKGCDMHGLGDLRSYLNGPWWSEFYKSLTEGGVLSTDGNAFDSNYAVWTFPARQVGVYGPEYFRVVNGANVPVFARPDPESPQVASLSYSLVVLEDPVVKKGWQRVEFKSGRSAFIDTGRLIDPTGESIRMRRIKGRWRLVGISSYCD